MQNKVVVVGSYNTDFTIKTGRIPGPGETVMAGIFSKGGGGKGANQAVAAVRAGADVSFIARVGKDTLGQEGMQRLMTEHINTKHVIYDPDSSTGVAFITVDERGENSIVVATGANAHLSPSDIEKAENEIATARVLLVQLESPLAAVQSAIHIARLNGVLVILNPAPAQPLDRQIVHDVDILTPNRVEAEMISGMKISDVESLRRVAQKLLESGINSVLITLGRRGVFLALKKRAELIPAFAVPTIDSTGAGDVFSGSLAAFLAEGMTIEESARMAVASASISVTRMGAQMSAPIRSELEAFILNEAPAKTEALG